MTREEREEQRRIDAILNAASDSTKEAERLKQQTKELLALTEETKKNVEATNEKGDKYFEEVDKFHQKLVEKIGREYHKIDPVQMDAIKEGEEDEDDY